MYSELLWSDSLRALPCGAAITRVLGAALTAADPAAAVAAHLQVRDGTLQLGARSFTLADLGRILVVGAGKAGAPMARAVAERLGAHIAAGLVVVKDGHSELADLGPIQIVEAGHPLPDARGAAAGAAMATLLDTAGPADLVIALISGGGSALLTLPAPGLALAAMQDLTAALLACGADIGAINTLRKHLDGLKGGGLARRAAPAALAALVLSDVVGSPLATIASGPTVPDPSSYADALAVLERFGLVGQTPAPILAHVRQGAAGALPETPKPGDECFARAETLLIGSNALAAQAALAAAGAAGFHTMLLTSHLQGEAREAGRFLGAVGRELALSGQPLPRPACLIVGGETTVTLRGNGRGGRNQELALGAVVELADLERVALVTLATDGGDGPTDAAGAVVTGATLARATAHGLVPQHHLARNDAYPFFDALGDLLRPGPTRTNVNDLAFLFTW